MRTLFVVVSGCWVTWPGGAVLLWVVHRVAVKPWEYTAVDSIGEQDNNTILVYLLKLALEDALNHSMIQLPLAMGEDVVRGWDIKLPLV